jgi:hypothetical protein
MALSTIASTIVPTPQTNAIDLASGLGTLEKTGQQNKDQLAATLSRPLPSDLRPSGTGIYISTNS